MKIYIHHFYTETLFLKLAHNSVNRNHNIVNDVGNVTFEYNGNNYEFVFDPILNEGGGVTLSPGLFALPLPSGVHTH